MQVRAGEGLASAVALGLENQVTWAHSGLPHGQFLHQQARGSKTGKNTRLVIFLAALEKYPQPRISAASQILSLTLLSTDELDSLLVSLGPDNIAMISTEPKRQRAGKAWLHTVVQSCVTSGCPRSQSLSQG